MKKQRLLASFTAVVMLLACFVLPIRAASTLTLAFADNVEENGSLSLGETVTYTVSITANEGGFCVGSFCFAPSDNLEYESATFLGQDAEAKLMSGEKEGAYGIKYLEKQPCTMTEGELCTITFRVVGLGDARVTLSCYQLLDAAVEAVDVQIPADTLTHPVATPDKPTVLTESLKDGVVDKAYAAMLETDFQADIHSEDIAWELTGESELPAGLELLNDGTITGTPTEFGTFTFSVTISLFDSIVSEAKELTLTILEKPKTLELNEDSTYTADEETGYLRNVVAETTLADLLAQFRNAENIQVLDAKGNEITSDTALVGTGYTVNLMDGEEVVNCLTIIVLGDVDGDGEILAFDYISLRLYLMNKQPLTGAFMEAADTDRDGEVLAFDYMAIRFHLMDRSSIYDN